MAVHSNTRRITLLLDESLIEELRGWLTINCGEITKVEKPRKKIKSPSEQQETEEESETSHFVDLQREVIFTAGDPSPAPEENLPNPFTICIYCRNAPCVLSETLPSKLRAYGQPRMTNHVKRKTNYKAFYTILNHKVLWRDPIYLERKAALGCYIDDVREVMPVCVVEDVRKRWPNPDGVPYCGHRRS